MPKPRAYDAAATRRRILDAASDAFTRNGYHATSMNDLLKAAEVPAGSLYHQFSSKKRVAQAVIAERIVPHLEETWIAPLRTLQQPADAILAVFSDTAAAIDRRKGKTAGCPVTNLAVELALVDRDLRAALDALFLRWESAIRERLKTHSDAAALSTTIVASFSGAMTIAKTAQSARPLEECARALRVLLKDA